MSLLQPSKFKYRNRFRGKNRGKSYRGSSLSFGDYGLKALEGVLLSSKQIEAGRRAITHHAKRGGKVWVRVFPDKPVSKRPPEVRMGKGKGPFDHFAAVVKPGRVLFEVAGIDEEVAFEALRRASSKLPVKTKIVSRET